MKNRILIIFMTGLLSLPSFAQQSAIVPRHLRVGPKGMDTIPFAEIAIFRDHTLQYDKYTMGVMIDNPRIIHAMINTGVCNVIRTRREGNITLYTRTDSAVGIPLHLKHGQRIYVLMEVSTKHSYPHPHLKELSREAGEKRLSECFGKVIYRHMSLGSNAVDYLEDFFPDTIRWKAGDMNFHFLRPPSMEVSIEKSFLVFHEPSISETYTEFLSIAQRNDKRIRNSESFREYLKAEARPVSVGKDRLLRWEELEEQAPAPGFAYYLESEDASIINKATGEPLLVRTVTCFLRVDALHRKGEYHVITLTERGMPSELSTREELLDKFERIWNSLRLGSE